MFSSLRNFRFRNRVGPTPILRNFCITHFIIAEMNANFCTTRYEIKVKKLIYLTYNELYLISTLIKNNALKAILIFILLPGGNMGIDLMFSYLD